MPEFLPHLRIGENGGQIEGPGDLLLNRDRPDNGVWRVDPARSADSPVFRRVPEPRRRIDPCWRMAPAPPPLGTSHNLVPVNDQVLGVSVREAKKRANRFRFTLGNLDGSPGPDFQSLSKDGSGNGRMNTPVEGCARSGLGIPCGEDQRIGQFVIVPDRPSASGAADQRNGTPAGFGLRPESDAESSPDSAWGQSSHRPKAGRMRPRRRPGPEGPHPSPCWPGRWRFRKGKMWHVVVTRQQPAKRLDRPDRIVQERCRHPSCQISQGIGKQALAGSALPGNPVRLRGLPASWLDPCDRAVMFWCSSSLAWLWSDATLFLEGFQSHVSTVDRAGASIADLPPRPASVRGTVGCVWEPCDGVGRWVTISAC